MIGNQSTPLFGIARLRKRRLYDCATDGQYSEKDRKPIDRNRAKNSASHRSEWSMLKRSLTSRTVFTGPRWLSMTPLALPVERSVEDVGQMFGQTLASRTSSAGGRSLIDTQRILASTNQDWSGFVHDNRTAASSRSSASVLRAKLHPAADKRRRL